ncbi:MAG TPA: PrgI family protein [Candidatus Paceibacterota bacterium]
MQFQVPQFIEVEDRIFGPLTFRQFIYVAGGGGVVYLLWRVLPLIAALPLIGLVGGLAFALAFMQYNGRPFIISLEHAFFFFLHPKLYLWNNRKKRKNTSRGPESVQVAADLYVPHLSDSKLHELAWSLDIKERIAAGTADEEERTGRGAALDVIQSIRTANEARI